MRYTKILWLVPCLGLLTAANVSNIRKTADKVIVQGRDGSTVSIQALNNLATIQSTNYTVTSTDGYGTFSVTTGSSSRTITLPPVASSMNRRIRVIKADTGSGSVVLAVSTGSLIGPGSSVPKVSSQGGVMDLVCDGVNWFLEALHDSGSFTATTGATTIAVATTWSYNRSAASVTINPVGNGSFGNYYLFFTKNGSTGNITITGLPVSISPVQAVTWVDGAFIFYNNAGTPTTGAPADAYIDNLSTINLSRDLGSDGFGSGTQSQVHWTHFTYFLQ